MSARTLTLDGAIKRRLWAEACGRNDGKAPEQSRLVDKTYGERESNYTGLKGEYVAATLLGVPYNRDAYGRRGDDGVDLWVRGVPCAVKTRHVQDGDLMVGSWREVMPVRVLMLVQGPCERDGKCVCKRVLDRFDEPERWTLCGWVWARRFIMEAREKDYGRGWRAVMSWRKLHYDFSGIHDGASDGRADAGSTRSRVAGTGSVAGGVGDPHAGAGCSVA